jgi:PAS domain S-box-containing protein
MPSARGSRIDQAVATAFISDSPDAFVAVDTAFRVIAWNRAAEHLFGWSAEEVLGRIPPHLIAEQEADIRSVLWGPIIEGFPDIEERWHRDGHAVAVRIERETALRDVDGEVLGWGRFMRAASIDEVRLRLRNVLSVRLAEAVSLDDVRRSIAEPLERLLGARRAVVIRRHGNGSTTPIGLGIEQAEAELLEIDEGLLRAVSSSRIAGRTTVRVDGTDVPTVLVPMGSDRWVFALLQELRPLPDDALPLLTAIAGEAWAALRRLELVTGLEARIAVLEASNAVSRTAGLDLQTLLTGICEQVAMALGCERVGIYLLESDDALRLGHLLGHDDEEAAASAGTAVRVLLGDDVRILLPGEGLEDLTGPWSPATGTAAVMVMPLRRGEHVVGAIVASHTADSPGGFARLSRHVGEAVAQHAATAVENARLFSGTRMDLDRLEELDERKADYVAGVSHDLRSPLAGMLASVRTMRRLEGIASAEERAEYLEITERQIGRLTGMVEDMLLGARLEAGRLRPDTTTRVDLGGLVDDLHQLLAPAHRERVRLSAGEAAEVCGDLRQLERVAQNLIDNALLHTPESTRIDVRTDRDGTAAILRVNDDGPGIPEAALSGIFARYGTGERRATGSTGLGLYTTRGIVESHGGTIEVRSSAEAGTTFVVRLPLAAGRC